MPHQTQQAQEVQARHRRRNRDSEPGPGEGIDGMSGMNVLIEGQTLVLSWLTNGGEISPPLGPAHQIPRLFWRHGSRAKLFTVGVSQAEISAKFPIDPTTRGLACAEGASQQASFSHIRMNSTATCASCYTHEEKSALSNHPSSWQWTKMVFHTIKISRLSENWNIPCSEASTSKYPQNGQAHIFSQMPSILTMRARHYIPNLSWRDS